MVVKFRERLALSKQRAHEFDEERVSLRTLSELEVRIQYQINISKSFAAFENLNDNEDINTVWGNIEANIKTSAKESLGLN